VEVCCVVSRGQGVWWDTFLHKTLLPHLAKPSSAWMSDEGESGASITLLLREAMEVEVHARRHRRRNEWAEAARVALACTPADSDLPLSGAASASTARLGVAQFVFDVPWPVSEVLHEGAVRKYNDIFGLVLQVKHAKHQLDEVRSCSGSHHSRRSAVLTFLPPATPQSTARARTNPAHCFPVRAACLLLPATGCLFTLPPR